MPASDAAVLKAIEGDIMRPDVIAATLQKAVAKLRPSADAAKARRRDLETRLNAVNRDLDRLTTAIVTTGPVPSVLDAIKARERERTTLTRDLRALDAAGKAVDWRTVERDLQAKLEDWRGLLQRHVPQARQVLKKLLHGHIVFHPVRESNQRFYTFTAPINLGRLLTGMASPNMMASPPGMDKAYMVHMGARIVC